MILTLTAPIWCEEETTTSTPISCKEGTDEYCGQCNLDKCTACYDSFTNPEGICAVPSIQIENCIQYSDTSTCKSCKLKYRLISNKCEEITVENCLKSDDNTTCTICDGLHEKNNNSKCSGTKCSIENCLVCKEVYDKEECSACDSGYYLKTDNTCLKLEGVNEGCSSLTQDKCTACVHGYYVNSKSGVSPMTCKTTTKYTSVRVFAIFMLSLLTTLLRFN